MASVRGVLVICIGLVALTGCGAAGGQDAVAPVTRSVTTATAGAETPNPPPRARVTHSASFTYGFDLDSQEPDPPASPAGRGNLAGPVATARQVMASLPGLMADQSIWGFGILGSPEPSPGVFRLGPMAARIAMIQAAGDIPVVTLVAAPNWMKTGGARPGGTLFSTPPSPDHYGDFAALAAHIAQAFPQVRYFVVWSEVRGFYSPAKHAWDYQDYTTMYNDVYRAIKAVRPDALVGGPYADLHAMPTPIRGVPSAVHGPWGYVDQGMLDTLTYWLAHKAGADFVAVDGATAVATTGDAALMNPVTEASQYAALDAWIRARTDLPIWWMESHIQPATGWTPAQAAAARIATLAEMAASGARVGMQWQPQQTVGWPDEGLWTSTRVSGGGQPTVLAKDLPTALPILADGPALVANEPAGVLVAHDAAGTLSVNTTDAVVHTTAGVVLQPGQVLATHGA